MTSANPIIIKLVSMRSSTEFGSAFDFPYEANRSFQFGTYDPGAWGNSNDLFAFDVSQFYHNGGTASDASLWAIDFNTSNGAITLTAVPEPSTYGLGLGALALAAAAIRRRKRQEKKA